MSRSEVTVGPTAPVAQEVTRLHGALSELEGLLRSLEERLRPVSGEPAPDVKEDNPPKLRLCPVGDSIRNAGDRVEVLQRLAQSMITNLEV